MQKKTFATDEIGKILDVIEITPEPTHFKSDNETLNQIIEVMHKLEEMKYPLGQFEKRCFDTNYNILYVEPLSADKKISESDIQKQEKKKTAWALKLRQYSMVGGVINAILFSNNFLINTNNIVKLSDEIIKHLNELLPSKEKNLDMHIYKIANILHKYTGEDENSLIHKIRICERYFVAEYNANKILINNIKNSKVSGVETNIIQVDIPYNNVLSEVQKKDYLKIHHPEPNAQPEWFLLLEDWEKDWFKQKIPLKMDGNWQAFEKIFQSSAMQHIPGIKNARFNYLIHESIVSGESSFVIHSHSLKDATFVPYEMAKALHKNATRESANQVFERIVPLANKNFINVLSLNNPSKSIKFFTDLVNDKKYKPVIYIQSLLSDTHGIFTKHDTSLAETQLNILQNSGFELQGFADNSRFKLLCSNEPTNVFRNSATQESRWGIVKQLKQSLDNFIETFENYVPQDQLKFLNCLDTYLTDLKQEYLESISKTNVNRNIFAYKAAACSLLVEGMGGFCSTNCKSGKDRTGIDEIYRHAMLEYYLNYGELPHPLEPSSSEKRKNFVVIFAKIFASDKQAEAAGMNTPGSFGLKDDISKIICSDIAKYLGEHYTQCNHRGGFNKQPIYKKDEKNQTAVVEENYKAIIINKQMGEAKVTHHVNYLTESNNSFIKENPLFEEIKKNSNRIEKLKKTYKQKPNVLLSNNNNNEENKPRDNLEEKRKKMHSTIETSNNNPISRKESYDKHKGKEFLTKQGKIIIIKPTVEITENVDKSQKTEKPLTKMGNFN